jgi:NhaP-type Na+/H+ or K+/H+ antiporter
MDRVILFKMIGLVLLVIGILALIAGILMANKFMQGTGFISVVIAGVMLYYSMSMTPADKPDADEERAFDEAVRASTTVKK